MTVVPSALPTIKLLIIQRATQGGIPWFDIWPYVMGMRMRVFSVKLDDETAGVIAAIAAANHVSRGHLVRRALRREYGNESRVTQTARGRWGVLAVR